MSVKKILIVEDDAILVSVLTDNLSAEGFEIIKAGNGEEGLAAALREHPDLILLDILMPVMDGITMLKKMRKDDWGKNAKVIMFTNFSEDEKVSEAIELGSYEYLVKSCWKIEDVVAKVREKLK